VTTLLNAEPHGYSEEARAILQRLGTLIDDNVSQDDLPGSMRGVDVLIVRLHLEVNRGVLESGTELRAVVTATTGLDHIDMEAAAARGVAVLSLRGERKFLDTIPATAELTWALLLSLVRRIPQAMGHVRTGAWDRDSLRGSELAGKRLGLLGLGRVGRQVARYGAAFGMEVAAFDPYTTEWLDGVKRCETLEDLLSESHVLSIHVPLDARTAGLLNEGRLCLLPEGALVVNTARGPILEEAALVKLLEAGYLAGAAVDVISGERDASMRNVNPLIRYAASGGNVVITPHIGGATVESMARAEVFMARKLASFLNGHIGDRTSRTPAVPLA